VDLITPDMDVKQIDRRLCHYSSTDAHFGCVHISRVIGSVATRVCKLRSHGPKFRARVRKFTQAGFRLRSVCHYSRCGVAPDLWPQIFFSRLRCLLYCGLELLRELKGGTRGISVTHCKGWYWFAPNRLVLAMVLHCRALGRCAALLAEIESSSLKCSLK
jgi:hypothetical protein